jgi:hypothetical protein
MNDKLDRAEKDLIKAMGENPRKLILRTVDVAGRTVHWEENCRATHKRSGAQACAHYRTALAPVEALDAFFAVVQQEDS